MGDDSLTHAGGVVVREGAAGPEVLIVTARRSPDLWVLPKGHLEPDETPEQTAAREVEEEAGVVGECEDPLGIIEFDQRGEIVRVVYFRMRFIETVPPQEDRQVAWVSPDEAQHRLRYDDVGALVRAAVSAT